MEQVHRSKKTYHGAFTIATEWQCHFKFSEYADYVNPGCQGGCLKENQCKGGARCIDDYNIFRCDCQLTPYYGYYCEKGQFLSCGLQLILPLPLTPTCPKQDNTSCFLGSHPRDTQTHSRPNFQESHLQPIISMKMNYYVHVNQAFVSCTSL